VKEKFYEKYAWIIFVLIGLMVLVGGIPHAFGLNTDPTLVQNISGQTIDSLKISDPLFFNLYNYYFSGGGISDIGVAFFLIVIAITAFRQAHKWAWFALWFVPVFFGSWIVLSSALPLEARTSLYTPLVAFIVLSIIGLLLPFRKFFPKKA
jgi:hypothetical protein